MQRKLEEMTEEKNELKTKVSNLESNLLYKSMQMKAMALHVERLEGRSRNGAVEMKAYASRNGK